MALNIKYCKLCSKPFNFKVTPYCAGCLIDIEEAFDKCRCYLDKNIFVGIKELSEKTEVSEKIILLLIKEGRLSLEGVTGITCEACGDPISKGRYCTKCTVKKQAELNNAKSSIRIERAPERKVSSTGKERMHIASDIKDKEEKRR